MSKYCKSCGAANVDAANVCTRCGKMLPYGGEKVTPMKKNAISETIKKPKVEKRTKYGIGIAVLCIVIIVIFVSMSNRGIVGTWESDEIVSGDYHVRNTIIFKKDNTGYITTKNLKDDDEGARSFQWTEMGDGRYMISCVTEGELFNREMEEVMIELGSNEFVIEPIFFSVDQTNIVYHRK